MILGPKLSRAKAYAMLLGRRNDIVTTGITTADVMVVVAISPQEAWKQPLPRLLDTIVGKTGA